MVDYRCHCGAPLRRYCYTAGKYLDILTPQEVEQQAQTKRELTLALARYGYSATRDDLLNTLLQYRKNRSDLYPWDRYGTDHDVVDPKGGLASPGRCRARKACDRCGADYALRSAVPGDNPEVLCLGCEFAEVFPNVNPLSVPLNSLL